MIHLPGVDVWHGLTRSGRPPAGMELQLIASSGDRSMKMPGRPILSPLEDRGGLAPRNRRWAISGLSWCPSSIGLPWPCRSSAPGNSTTRALQGIPVPPHAPAALRALMPLDACLTPNLSQGLHEGRLFAS